VYTYKVQVIHTNFSQLANGIFLYIASSVAMSTLRQRTTCRDP
jgi:hypothetical protein